MIPSPKLQQRVVIKIGSSSLTSRNGEISWRKLERITDEIVYLRDLGHEVVLVSSGAVAAGYRKLGCLERPTTLPQKQAAAAIGQGLLMESYSKLFLSHGYVAAQILITRSDFLNENSYINVRNTLNVLLQRGIIPIVNENDTVTIDRLKFGDNDRLSAKVAGLIDADQLVILSDIDGLYDADPTSDSNAKLLKSVSKITPEIEAAAGGSGSVVGTGGMKSKIEAVKIAMASGITTYLGNASLENGVRDAILGKAKGTYFKGKTPSQNLNQKKKWIAFNSGPEGEILISQEAKHRIIEKNQCLSPLGVRKVKGRFKKGAVIKVNDTSGNQIGLGIVKVSSKELTQLLEYHPDSRSIPKTVVETEDFVCMVDLPSFEGISY
ncbi:glutamate 5-kinase [Bacillus sp. USDA818B3_A]|uniref:glutamate 5-kinase n=1 Tax=Bacillus sp. USDA818B3_A TaxID=2698834 RepID=UPI00136F2166|nr:glutamate 5-kinase [Bacillus sp. USDA818B3_A]